MSFKVIDIIFIVIILILGFSGLKRGFFSQVITIVGILAGLFLAYFFSDDLSVYVAKVIGEKDINNLISFVLIFVAVILVSMLLNKIFKETLNQLGAEGLDKILGFSFGLLQGLFICIGITALLVIQPLFDPEPIFTNSIIGSWMLSAIPQLEKLIPTAQEFLGNMETEV